MEVALVANLPDPWFDGRDLTTPSGEAVEYRDRLDLVVTDDRRALVGGRAPGAGRQVHRPPPARLDERSAAACWSWGAINLSTPVAGTLTTSYCSRRPPVPTASGGRWWPGRPPGLLRDQAQLAHEALDMADPGVRVYPNARAEWCTGCAYRAPCRAPSEGARPDAEAILAEGYRPAADEAEPGRLGTTTWSMGRGAAPRGFGRRP